MLYLMREVARTVNQIGLGASVEYRISDIYFVTLDGMTAGLGGGAIQSHLAVDLSIVRKKSGELGYGIGFRFQTYSAVRSLGISRTISHNTIYLLLAI